MTETTGYWIYKVTQTTNTPSNLRKILFGDKQSINIKVPYFLDGNEKRIWRTDFTRALRVQKTNKYKKTKEENPILVKIENQRNHKKMIGVTFSGLKFDARGGVTYTLEETNKVCLKLKKYIKITYSDTEIRTQAEIEMQAEIGKHSDQDLGQSIEQELAVLKQQVFEYQRRINDLENLVHKVANKKRKSEHNTPLVD